MKYLSSKSLEELVHKKLKIKNQKEIKTFIVAATSVYASTENLIELLEKEVIPTGFKTALEFISYQKIKQLRRIKTNLIGVWWHYINIESHLQPISSCLSRKKNLNVINIVDVRYALFVVDAEDLNFSLQDYLIVTERQYSALNFLQVIFIQEDYHKEIPFPFKVIRVGLPHGSDISVETTVNRYAGWMFFDYIFCGAYEKLDFNVIGAPCPQNIVQKQSNNCVLIPGGTLKLDEFIRVARNSKISKKIVLQVANLDVESNFIKSNLLKLLLTLADKFKDYELVFRFDPVNRNETLIRNIIKKIKYFKNVRVSHSFSYIEDYKDALFLISTRDASGKNFTTATGRPIIFFSNQDQGRKIKAIKRFGFKVFSTEQLFYQCNEVIKFPSKYKNFEGDLVFNKGRSGPYLLKAIKKIINRESDSDWVSVETPFSKKREGSLEIVDFLERHAKLDKPNFSISQVIAFTQFVNPLIKFRAIENMVLSQRSMDTEIRVIRFFEACNLLVNIFDKKQAIPKSEITRFFKKVLFISLVKALIKSPHIFFQNITLTSRLIFLFVTINVFGFYYR